MWVQSRILQAVNGATGVFDVDYQQDVSFRNCQMPGLAIGGVGIERRAGVATLTTGTTLPISGLGFSGDGVPDLLLFSTGFAPIGNTPHFTEGAKVSYGACGPDLSQWAVGLYRGYASGSAAYTVHTDDSVLAWGYPGKVWVASLDSDGFTLEWDSISWTSGEVGAIGWLALKLHGGLKCKVGTLTQPTSTGVQTLTGWGFTPAGLMLSGVSLTAFSSTWAGGARHNVGFAATDGGETAMNGGHRINERFETAVAYKDDRVVYLYEHDGSTLAVRGDANAIMVADGIELDWTVVDGVARKLGYIALDANEPADGSPPLVHIAAVGQAMLDTPGTFLNPSLPYTDSAAGLGWSISPTNSFMGSAWWGGDSVVFHYARDRVTWGGGFFPSVLYRLAVDAAERLKRLVDVIRHNAPR